MLLTQYFQQFELSFRMQSFSYFIEEIGRLGHCSFLQSYIRAVFLNSWTHLWKIRNSWGVEKAGKLAFLFKQLTERF